MNQKLGTIYIATNIINGKQYVGQTIRDLKERIYGHKNKSTCPIIHSAIKKYGFENFKWISFSCPEEEMDWQEIFLIKELNTLAPNGYNLDSGGHKNKHHHESTKEKIREMKIGKPGTNLGKIFSKEHRRKISESKRGEKHWQYGKPPWNKGIPQTKESNEKRRNTLLGIKRSEETKQKMKNSALKRWKGVI
jgi:group I intron endonuclease